MAQVLRPWQILVATFAVWINEHQQAVIDYLREENQVLKEQLGGKWLCSPTISDGDSRPGEWPLTDGPWKTWLRSSRPIPSSPGIGS